MFWIGLLVGILIGVAGCIALLCCTSDDDNERSGEP